MTGLGIVCGIVRVVSPAILVFMRDRDILDAAISDRIVARRRLLGLNRTHETADGVSCRERSVLYRTVLDRRRRILPRGIRPYADQPAYAIHARGVDRHVFDMAVRDIGIAAHAADQRSDPFSLNLGIVVQWDRYVFQRQLPDRRLLAQRLADESFGVGNDVDVEVGDGVARSVEFAVEGAFVDAAQCIGVVLAAHRCPRLVVQVDVVHQVNLCIAPLGFEVEVIAAVDLVGDPLQLGRFVNGVVAVGIGGRCVN